MARHTGKNLKVKVGPAFISGALGFDLTETSDTAEITAAGDAWKDFEVGINGWSGSITMRADHGAQGQTLRAGEVVVLEGYTEGDGAGKTYLGGTAIIGQHQVDVRYDGVVGRQYSVTGKGALNIVTV